MTMTKDSTKREKIDGRANLLDLLAKIKSAIGDIDEASRRAETRTTQLYVDVYAYIEGVMGNGLAKSMRNAFKGTADAIGKPWRTVSGWYYRGKIMRENNIPPGERNSRAIALAWRAKNRLAKADYFAVVSSVKRGDHPGKTARILAEAQLKSGAEVERKIENLKKHGELTKTRVRLEMMAMHTMLKKFFKSDGQLAFCNAEGEILMSVGLASNA